MSESSPELSELTQIPERAARSLTGALASVDLHVYKRFLSFMYHYTRGSGAKAAQALASSERPDVSQFLERMRVEEGCHHRLAQADLKALGGTVAPVAPDAVQRFDVAWRGLAGDGCFAYLGAIYVFENTGRHLRDPARDAIARLGLGPAQTRWVRTHLKADLEHGAAASELCHRYFSQAGTSIVRGARTAERAWVGVFSAALESAEPAVS